MSDIFERLMQMDRDRPSERAMPLPEAIIERMREAAPRFNGPCQFMAGDVVTAVRGGIVKEAFVGLPFLVLRVDDTLGFQWHGESGTVDLGARLNMRILSYEPGHDVIVARWVDSADYELFSEYQARQNGGGDAFKI